jgi:hypothetical protein
MPTISIVNPCRPLLILDGLEVRYIHSISTNDNNDFIMGIRPQRYGTGSGEVGRWTKQDMKKFVDNEDKFIKYFTDGINNPPCELIEKKNYDVAFGYKTYNYYFKLLV